VGLFDNYALAFKIIAVGFCLQSFFPARIFNANQWLDKK
jgi:hypothetical protein